MTDVLHANEVMVISRRAWESTALATHFGAASADCASIVVMPDPGDEHRAGRTGQRHPSTAAEVFQPVVDWLRTWAPAAALHIDDGHRRRGSPPCAVTVNLREQSALFGLQGRRYHSAEADTRETNRHHTGAVHEYTFSATVLRSDMIVTVPKLKTHGKAGINASMTNAINLAADPNLLPQYTMGTPKTGGDAYRSSSARFRLESVMMAAARPVVSRVVRLADSRGTADLLDGLTLSRDPRSVRAGNWFGNDTLWRTILDVNRALRYAQADGTLATTPQRRTFSIVNALVSGDGEAPILPTRSKPTW
ncbi:DUF362 domain-containing protein [Mycolicibacterium aichiense]|uniref:DUF362 domain-containing protein n=1 Tax=Mycolicibacterium aichiense TaxID=1799 RepID=UPI003D66FEAD